MKPVKQERLDDCVRACVATVLEVPLVFVPHFEPETWQGALIRWLKQFNLGLINVRFMEGDRHRGYGLGAVESPTEGWLHCVVVNDGKIVYDPSKLQVFGKELKEISYFTVLDPSKPVKIEFEL